MKQDIPYLTPISYLGNRELEKSIDSILKLLPLENKIHTFYDLFCGSGSVSIHAMSNNFASRYVLNDTYLPLITLHKLIKENPKLVIDNYFTIYSKLFEIKDTCKLEVYYNLILDNYNKEDKIENKALNLLFLLNFSDGFELLFDNNKLCSKFNLNYAKSQQDEIKNSILECYFYYKNNSVNFYNYNFSSLLNEINSDDFVYLDPPYPVVHQTKTLFDRPLQADELHQEIINFISQLNAKRVPFLLFYGKLTVNDNYLINSEKYNTHHFVCLTGKNSNKKYESLEHVYLSKNANFSGQLPKYFIHYEKFKHKSIQYIKNYIEKNYT